MGKLRQLREWQTIAEAAEQLSEAFGEVVSEADVLRLALENQLALSVDLVNGARASARSVSASPTDVGGPMVFDEAVETIFGVWDLPMLGGERLSVEAQFQKLSGGPGVDLASPHGVLVQRADRLYQLQDKSFDPAISWPSSGLPRDSRLVVRTAALVDFQTRSVGAAKDTSMDRQVQKRERTTLLVIIAALAKEARIDVCQVSKAGAAIEAMTTLIGARVPGRTVEEHLKRIPDALERRARSSS